MKPDQHKAKQSVRWKKKHEKGNKKQDESQSSNKRKDRVRSGQLESQELTNNDRFSRVEKHDDGGTSLDFTSGRGPGEMEELTNHNYHEDSKLESNWHYYDMTKLEEVENKTTSGVNFTQVIASTVGALQQFRFHAEDEDDQETFETSLTDDRLAVDLNKLSSAIKCVPMNQRLAIDPNLIDPEVTKELESIATKHTEFYLNDTTKLPTNDSQEEETKPNTSATDRTLPCDNQVTETVLDDVLDDILSSTSEIKSNLPVTKDLTQNGSCDTHSVDSTLLHNSEAQQKKTTNESENKNLNHNNTVGLLDDLLDNILTSDDEQTTNNEVENNKDTIKDEPTHTKETVKTEFRPAVTENLEDWLDNFLDD